MMRRAVFPEEPGGDVVDRRQAVVIAPGKPCTGRRWGLLCFPGGNRWRTPSLTWHRARWGGEVWSTYSLPPFIPFSQA